MIRTTKQDLINLFRALEINSGDTVVAHTALFSLGLIEDGVGGFYNSLRNVIGDNGTLIVPTFTYSFRRNEIFDIKNSASCLHNFRSNRNAGLIIVLFLTIACML